MRLGLGKGITTLLFIFIFFAWDVGIVSAQSRIPAETDNFLQTTGLTGNGDQDIYMVVFYEVPDTITSTLYFAINDPGCTGVSPDEGTGGTWNYYLVGGNGTISSSISRQLTFANLAEATTGTVLHTRSFTTEAGWHYFAGVSPSQGEKIGNKYYFKIVAQAPSGNGNKNAYQLDVSFSNSGSPTGSSEIRAFAYAWTLALLNRTTPPNTWNLYPFVPDNATGNIDYRNWDMDNGETLLGWDKSGNALAPNPTVSGNNVEAATSYSIGTETNGTWRLQITEDTAGGIAINTSVFWFTIGSTILRTYAAPYTPPAPYAVTITPTSVTALTGTNPSFNLQIVDSNGNPVPYVRNLYVTVSGSATINPNNNGTPATELLATNNDGLATFTVTDAVAETVTITVYWDGTGGSSSFGSASFTTALVTFQADLPPSISSASNLTYYSNQAAPINLPVITIVDSGLANITAANDIRIRIPTSLQAEFLTSVTTPTLAVGGTGGGAVSATVSYPNSKTLLIDVTTDFAVTNTLTIGGATPLQINDATDAPSSGRLEMSVDGGTTWNSVDDKLITILDPNPTYIWSGGTDTNWATGSNWAGGTAPSLNDGTENIIIPGGRPNYPILPNTDWSINQLTIDIGASLTIGANNLTINGTFSNSGTLIISGAGRPNKNDTAKGTVRYTVVGGTITDFGATDYYNLELNGAGTFTATTAMVVANALTVTNSNGVTFQSTLTAPSVTLTNTTAGQTIDFQGGVTITSLTTAAQGFNVAFNTGAGGQSSTITNAVTFNNTGTLTLGNDAADSITCTGGITKTVGAKSLAGTISATNAVINLGTAGNITLTANTTVSSGTGAITLFDIPGPANVNLVLNGSGTNTLGVVNLGTGTLDLSGLTGGTTTVNGGLTAQTLSTPAAAVNLAFNAGGGGQSSTITNAVTFNNTGTLTLGNDVADSITFTGGVTATAPSIVSVAGTISSGGGAGQNISLGDGDTPVTLSANTTLSAGAGNITLGGTVNADLAANNRTLTLNSTGTTTLGGVVGGTQALLSITTNAGGNTQINTTGVTTSGTQTYNDAVVLGANTTLTTTNSNVSFAGTVNGAQTLAISVGTGLVSFGTAVGGGTALASVSVTSTNAGANAITVRSVTTTGAQTYTGNVTLGAATTLTTTANGSVSITGTVTGAQDLTISANGTGTVSFGGDVTVGATAAGALSITAASLSLGLNVDISTAAVNGNISFTVDGLTLGGTNTINAGTGTFAITPRTPTYTVEFSPTDTILATDVYYNSAFTGVTAGSFRVGAASHTGTIYVATAAMTPTYSLTVQNNGTIEVRDTYNSSAANGNLTLDSGAGGIALNGGTINLGTGTFTAQDAVTLGANTTITANGGIAFQSTINADNAANNRTLTLNCTGAVSLSGAVGTTQALQSLTSDAVGTLTLQAVTTRGAQTYNDATVTLNGTLTVNTAGAGVSIPNNVVLGAGSGTITLTGTDANNDITLGAISGAQALTLTAGGGDISIGSTNGTPTGLTSTSATFTTTGSVTVAAGSAISITTDQIALGGTLGNSGAGAITLQPTSDGVTIGLNDPAGTFNLTATELGYLMTTGTVTIGRATGTGTITIGGSGNTNLSGTTYNLTIEGTSSPISFAASTLTLAAGRTLSFSNGGNITVTAGATHVSIGGAGTIAFPQAGSVGASGNPLVVLVSNLGASTLTGGLYLQAQTNFTVSGAISTTNNPVDIDTGANTFSSGFNINAGSSTFTLTAADVNLTGGVITANGGIVFQPNADGTAIYLNNGGVGFSLDATELTTRIDSTGTLTIGRATGTGTITIGGSGSINAVAEGYNVTLRGASSSVVLNFGAGNTLTLANNRTFTFATGGAITSPGGAAADITIGGTGSLVISSATTVGTSADPLRVAVANLGGIASNGDLYIQDADGFTINGAVTNAAVAPVLSFDGGTGTITTSGTGTITAGSGGGGILILTADDMVIGTTLTANGGILIVPSTSTRSITLNDGTAGTLSLTATELQNLSCTGTVTIGRSADGTGTIYIGGSGNTNLSSTSYNLVLEGLTSPVSIAATTLTLGNGKTLTFSNGGNITVVAGATHVSIGGAGTITFSQAGSVGASGNPLVVSVSNLGASTLSGGLYLQNTTNLTVSGSITAVGVDIDTGTNSLTLSNPVAAGTGNLILTADTLTLSANVSGAGTLTLQPFSAGRLVSIGAAGAQFDLTDAEIGYLQDGFSSITIGRNTSGAVTVDTAAFVDPVTIISGSTVTLNAGSPTLSTTQDNASITVTSNGTINVNGSISAHGTGTVTLTASGGASNIAIAADIQSASNGTLTLTAGQNITRTAGTVGPAGSTSLLVMSASGGIGAGGASIATDVGTIRASAGGNIYISEASAVQLGDGVGGVSTSGGLIDIVAGGTITFGNAVTTTGTGTSISLNATAGGIAISQNIAAANNATITLTTGGGGNITRTAGTLGAAVSTSLLVLSASGGIGAGGASIATDVGTIRASAGGNIYISEASAVQLGDATGPVTTTSGVIDITAAGNITTGVWAGGDIISTSGGAGSITLTTTAGGTLTLSDSVSSVEGGLITLTNAGLLTISAPITARGGITQNGAGAVSLGANITTTGDAVSFQRAVTLASNVTIDTTNAGVNPTGGNITFQNTLGGAQPLTLYGGTGGIVTFTGAVGAPSLTSLTVVSALSTVFSSTASFNGPVNITANEIDLNGGAGSFSGNNTLILQPLTTTQAIAIGGAADTGAGTLDLTATDIAALANGFTLITIGSVAGSGAITVSGAVTFADPVTIRSPAGAGSITVSAQITGSDDASITLDAGTGGISLGASIVTAGNAITLQDPVTVTANISLDTTNAGAVPIGATITLNGTVNGDLADTRQLTLRCGQQTLSITQAIGSMTRFQTVTVRADDIALTATLSAQTINLYTGTPASRAMVIGDSGGGSFSLSDAEVALLSGFSTLVIGENGQQAATVTLRTVTSPVPAAAIDVYANNGMGGIVLDDEGSGTALSSGGTGNLTLMAGTGGITAAIATNAFAELSTAGTITLTSGGAIGSATNRVQFPAGQSNVTVTNAPGGVWFGGLGSLSLGAVTTNSTGASGLDVTSAGLLTLAGAVSTSSGNITLNPAGNGITTNGTINGNSLTITNGGTVSLNNTITVPNGFSSAGTSFDNTGATITTTNTALTINHSGAVTVDSALSAGNGAITITSTGGAVSINASVTGGSGTVSVTSNASTVTLNAPINVSTGTVSIDSATGTTITAAGDITATGAAMVNIGQTLASNLSTAGDVTTAAGNVRYYRSVTLTGNVTVSTGAGGGNVTFDQDVSGAFSLSVIAGTGNVTFSSTIGGGVDPTGLSISTSGNVTFTGAVNIAGNMTVSGTDVAVNSGIYGSAAGNVQITNIGTLAILDTTSAADDVTADINILGSFSQISGGGGSAVSIAGDIVTSAGNSITFNSPLTLTGNLLLQANGAGNVTINNTVNPTTATVEGLRIFSATGNVSVTGPVGNSNRLGALVVSSANNVTFTNAVTAVSYTQAAGTGTTTFNGAEDYTGVFSFTGTNLVQNGAATVGGAYSFSGVVLTVNNGLTVTGAATITNSGLFTKNATGVITANGGFTQNGTGANSVGANISTVNTALSFATAITLTQSVVFSTGAGAGDITLGSTVNPTTASTEGLTLLAGTGNVSVTGPVGNSNRLGALVVSSANNVTFTNAVTAVSYTQAAGTGTTTFNGAEDYTGVFSFTGTNLVQNGAATVGGAYSFSGVVLTVNNGLTVTGAATITNSGLFTKNATGVITANGGFTQNGTGDVDIKSDITTANQPIRFNSNVHATNNVASMTWNAGTADIQNLGNFNLHVYVPGQTLHILSNITVRNFLLYAGTVNLNGKNLTTVEDVVLFGAGYNNDDDDSDDGSGPNVTLNVFAYTAPGRTADGGTRADPSVSTVPSTYLQGAPYNLVAETSAPVGGYGAAGFADLVGSTITVGKNFYANGTTLNANMGNWNLVIQSDVGDAAVAFAEAYNLTVNYCQATRVIAAAENVTAPSTGVGANTNWDTTRAVLVPGNPGAGTGTYTVYDNVIRVEFSKPIENTRNEINEVIGYSATVTNLRTNNGSVSFVGAFIDPECTTSTNGQGNLSVFYLKVADADRWNTDATGTSAGNAGSTDRGRLGVPPAHQTKIPNLWFVKTGGTGATALEGFFLFRDSSKNRLRSTAQEAQSATPGYDNPTQRFTGVADGCRPVLVAVQRGRAPHDEDSTGNPLTYRPYDAHNYLHIRYSEPVNIGTDPAFQIGAGGSAAVNVRAQSTFGAANQWGGHLTSTGGVATLVGFFSYPGTIDPGSRDGNIATNSLYRASLNGENPAGDHGLTVYISGFSFISGAERYWPGYHTNLSDPAGQTITVLSNTYITDAAGNPIEPSANPYIKATITVQATPTVAWDPSNASVGAGMPATNFANWDIDPPAFSTYLPGDIKEVVSRATTITNLINRMEFFIQDNSSEDLAWDPTENWTGPPDPDAHPDRPASRSHFGQPNIPRGIRDSTWSYPDALDKRLAFQFEAVGITPLLNTYNTGYDTTVNNSLFTEVNTRDDPYFTVLLQDSGHPWGLITQLWFTYDHTKAYLTDLAGNLLPSTPYPYLAIERTPPTIELALASAKDSKVYVKFSEPVFGDRNNTAELSPSKFVINNGFSVTRVEPITRGENPLSVYDAWVYLDRALSTDEVLTTTVALEGPQSGDPTKGVWDKTGNAALSTDVHRITDIGLGVVTPVWASDGLAVEGKPMEESSNTIRAFDGTGRLQVRDIVLQARIEAPSFTNLPLTLFYDVDVPEQYFNKSDEDPRRNFPSIWLPIRLRGLNPMGNPDARAVFPYQSQGALKNFLLPGTDSEFKAGKTVDFVFRLGNLFCARLADPNDPTSLVPWSFTLQEPIRQRGGVSIYNNVINPENGEKAVLTYEVTRPGMVTVQVFSLDGSLVYVIHRGPQGKGTYTYTWNGRNMGNRIVARGIYFIRVIGPDMDEIRKVMVVK